MGLLTDVRVKQAKTKAAYERLADGEGLYLLVTRDGRKYWRWDYRFAGKDKTLSFGSYPGISLKQARSRHLDARQVLASGRDPSLERKRARREQARAHAGTFDELARDWFELHQRSVAPSTLKRNRVVYDNHLKPVLGTLPVNAIEPPDVLDALRRAEKRGLHSTAHRAKEIAGMIFRYGIATGVCSRDQTADLRDALVPVPTLHYPAITDPDELGRLLLALESLHGFSRNAIALSLLVHLFVRPGELRLAEWSEFPVGVTVWDIPSTRIKTRTPFLVPLSSQARALVEGIRAFDDRGGRYVLPSSRSIQRPISDATFTAVLAQAGYTSAVQTPHGFRATARTILRERLEYPRDVIETQLNHVPPGLGAAYDRTVFLRQRTEMMQAWSNYLDELRDRARAQAATAAAARAGTHRAPQSPRVRRRQLADSPRTESSRGRGGSRQ